VLTEVAPGVDPRRDIAPFMDFELSISERLGVYESEVMMVAGDASRIGCAAAFGKRTSPNLQRLRARLENHIGRVESLATRLARLIHPSVRSTIQRFGNTTNPSTFLSDDVYGNAVRFERGALRNMLVMPSGDEYLLACFVLGARGSQVSIAGTIPETVVALDRGISAGDLAAARAVREMIWPLQRRSMACLQRTALWRALRRPTP